MTQEKHDCLGVHRPSKKTKVDTYIEVAKCIDCGLDLYYMTEECEMLSIAGRNKVMRKIQELSKPKEGDQVKGLKMEELDPALQKQIKDQLARQNRLETGTTGTTPPTSTEVVKVAAKVVPSGESPGTSGGQPVNSTTVEAQESVENKDHVAELLPVPPPPKGNRAAMHDYWVTNGSQILAEIDKLGFRATRTRWGLSSSTIYYIRHGWPKSKAKQNTGDELPPVPEKPKHGDNVGIANYYKEHAAQILEELKQLGEKAVRERWSINKKYWIKFRHDNGLPIRANKKRLGDKTVTDSQVIVFPAFNPSWPVEVMVTWLEVYKDLRLGGAFKQ